MQTKFFCDLYVSEGWEKKKLKLIKKLQKNKLQPSVYVIYAFTGKAEPFRILFVAFFKATYI